MKLNWIFLVEFLKQSKNPRADFKALTLKAINFTNEPFVLFAVDDIIITRSINLDDCVAALEKENAYGLFFRLGKNITKVYMTRQQTPVPSLIKCSNSFFINGNLKIKPEIGVIHTILI